MPTRPHGTAPRASYAVLLVLLLVAVGLVLYWIDPDLWLYWLAW